MGHHDHAQHAEGGSDARIGTAFFLNLTFTILEVFGGFWANSMAVLSDALHDLGDCVALALTWHFSRVSRRSGDETYTFGYRRFSLLGVLIMSAMLFAGGLLVVVESVPRLVSPPPANGRSMLLLAGVGIAVNGLAALRMRGGRTLGERVVTWHFVEDVLGWVAILIAGAVMTVRDLPILDPILSILITLYVLWNVGKRLKEALVILLQGVPDSVQIAKVEEAIRAVPGICDVHHTHVWSQDGVHHVLTTHAVVADADSYERVAALRRRVKDEVKAFGIHHATIEFESREGPGCCDTDASCRG